MFKNIVETICRTMDRCKKFNLASCLLIASLIYLLNHISTTDAAIASGRGKSDFYALQFHYDFLAISTHTPQLFTGSLNILIYQLILSQQVLPLVFIAGIFSFYSNTLFYFSIFFCFFLLLLSTSNAIEFCARRINTFS